MNRFLVLTGCLLFGVAQAAVQTKAVAYKDGDTALQGHLYWDDAIAGKRPGVMVIHEWWGLDDYAKKRAKMLAELGYVAFAADMYGSGKVTRHAKDAKGWMKQITANIDDWRRRAQLGLDVLMADPHTEASKLAAIGYCFGGATVMQMAYAGVPLAGVVSFHGSLPMADLVDPGEVKARVLVAHGDSDPFVPAEKLAAFKASLDLAEVDWEIDIYAGARHSFTNKGADSLGMDALQYNEQADRRSWARMQAFFKEIFNAEQAASGVTH